MNNLTTYGTHDKDITCQSPLHKEINFDITNNNKFFARITDIQKFNPPTGLVLWVDSTDINNNQHNLNFINVSTTNINSWVNKVGNGLNLTSSPNRPTLYHSRYNDHYANFLVNLQSSSNQYLETTINSNFNFYSSGTSIFVVFSSNNANNTIIETYNSASAFRFTTRASYLEFTRASGSTSTLNNNVIDGKLYLLSFIGPPSSACQFWINGISTGELLNPCTQNVNENKLIRIGATRNTGVLTEYLNGNIAEVMIFNKVVSNDERMIIENYLMNKWNLQ